MKETQTIICDGCNVREPFEHRCNGNEQISVRGEIVYESCECKDCNDPAIEADRQAWISAGMPSDWVFAK